MRPLSAIFNYKISVVRNSEIFKYFSSLNFEFLVQSQRIGPMMTGFRRSAVARARVARRVAITKISVLPTMLTAWSETVPECTVVVKSVLLGKLGFLLLPSEYFFNK